MKIQRTKNEKKTDEKTVKSGRKNQPLAPVSSTRKTKDVRKTAGKPAVRRKETPTRRDLLALKPVRNPILEWNDEDGHVVLTIRRAKDWKTRVVLIFTQVPEERRVVLDPIGTHVWRMLDGATTFDTIARSLAKEFKLMPREAELSLQQFFKELGQRGYIVFMK